MGGKWNFVKALYSLEISRLMEYRFNFFTQACGMMINDFIWILLWILLYQRFPSINGWILSDMLLLYAIFTAAFGIAETFFGSRRKIVKMIQDGQLDYYLALPKNELFHMLASISFAGIGDLLFGLILVFFALPIAKIPLYLVFVFTSGVILLSWDILVSVGAFYVGRFESTARAAREALMIFGGYPFSVYTGFTRFVLLFIIPAGMVVGVPVQLLREFSWTWMGIILGFTVLLFVVAVAAFYQGLKRYESGNVMVMRG